MQRSCQNSSLSPSVPLDIWFQSLKKKSNHNNTLAPFCYLIALGLDLINSNIILADFLVLKLFLIWYYDPCWGKRKPYLNTLTSFLHQSVQDQGIRNIADIIFYDRTVFLFSEAKWSQSLSDCVLFLTEMQHEILSLDIVAEIFQRPNRYLVTALSI